MDDPVQSKFVKHVLKYRPDSTTARLAVEVKALREEGEAIREWEQHSHMSNLSGEHDALRAILYPTDGEGG